jgi:hypothetical protein
MQDSPVGETHSLVDIPRLEEPWNDEAEKLLQTWVEDCGQASTLHDQAGKRHKCLFTAWSIPGMLLSVVMGGLSGTFADDPQIKYANMVGFIGIGVVQGVTGFFNFGKKSQRHFDYSSRYMTIATDIQTILVKRRSFRIPSDVCLSEIRMRLAQLHQTAPVL